MNFKKTTLENGLRVISASMTGAKSVTVLVLVGVGSEYETKELNGISHFFEHMCFKGTKKRPRKEDIARELDSLGANYNALTSEEITGYFVRTASDYLDIAFDVVSDILLNSRIPAREVKKEQRVIIEEINMYHDNPMSRVDLLWSKLLYGDQPAGWDIAGTKETVSSIQRSDIVKYMKERYVAQNTVLVVAGKVSHRLAQEKARQYFGGLNSGIRIEKPTVIERQSRPEQAVLYKDSDQAHILLGVRALSLGDKRRHALRVLNVILGGNMSSRLFIKVREERGLAYYIRSLMDCATDHGVLVAKAGLNISRIEEAIEIILREFKRFSKSVTDDELERAKRNIKGSAKLSLEASNAVAMFLGEQEVLLDEAHTSEEEFKKIDAVTIGDVRRVAQEIFRPERLNLAVVGPFKDDKKFRRLLENF